MKIQTATDVAKLALVGGVLYVGYRAVRSLGDVPSVTETATNAYWRSSLGDLTAGLADFYTNGWGAFGDSWGEPFSEQQSADAAAAADDVNRRLNWEYGGLSTL